MALRSLPKLPARSVLLSGLALATAGAVASGFPIRVGVTGSGANLSLPGDLLIPAPRLQADRAHEFRADAAQLWPQLLAVEDLYTFLWDRPLTVVTEQPGEVLVWETGPSGSWQGTVTAALLPGTDGHTVVHLRERYAGSGAGARKQIGRAVLSTAITAPLTWIRFHRSLR